MLPIKHVAELPSRVQRHLPDEAQQLYMKVYNDTWHREYDAARYADDPHLKAHCHRQAWHAVKARYEPEPGHRHWVERMAASDDELPPLSSSSGSGSVAGISSGGGAGTSTSTSGTGAGGAGGGSGRT